MPPPIIAETKFQKEVLFSFRSLPQALDSDSPHYFGVLFVLGCGGASPGLPVNGVFYNSICSEMLIHVVNNERKEWVFTFCNPQAVS